MMMVQASLIMYRYNRLDQAALKAQYFNNSGYQFPWESAFTGAEVCPGGYDGPNQEGKYELHITGDIGFALKQYWDVTGDVNWLQSIGYPMISGIADFWVSRSTPLPTNTSQFGINMVQPPDEYHWPVNNSVYTNVVASLAINFAIEAAGILGETPGSDWSNVADNLVVLFDEELQIHPEYDGYTNEVVKQADVILLGFPLLYDMPAQVRANDLIFYEPLTDLGGPAMTWAMFAIGWIDLGNYTKAAELFLQGYANIQAPFNVWQETPTGGTVNFITGAGGFLQSVVFGQTGLRIRTNQLTIQTPPLPQNATLIRLTSFHYQGYQLTLESDGNTVTISVVGEQPGANAIQLVYQGAAPAPLTVGTSISYPRMLSVAIQVVG